jgi:hypothetical protein
MKKRIGPYDLLSPDSSLCMKKRREVGGPLSTFAHIYSTVVIMSLKSPEKIK